MALALLEWQHLAARGPEWEAGVTIWFSQGGSQETFPLLLPVPPLTLETEAAFCQWTHEKDLPSLA